MKLNKRNIAILVVIFILLLCLALYLVLTNGQSYKSVKCSVQYYSDTLVSPKDLATYVKKQCDPIKGQLKRKVSLPHVESQIRHWPFCDSVSISTDIRGDVYIKMVQSKVVARVINKAGDSFYLASQGSSGKMVPYLEGKPVRVLIVNGNISDVYQPDFNFEMQDTSLCKDLLDIAVFIDSHPFWKAQISQIYVERKGMYLLSPLVGNHLITLGNARDLDQKFDNLWNLYKQGFNVVGWYRYSNVNLQFGNKIPCEKRSF